jgi:hypothetical protein
VLKKLTSLDKSVALLAKLEKEMSELRKKMNAVRLQIKLIMAKKPAKQKTCQAPKNGEYNPN